MATQVIALVYYHVRSLMNNFWLKVFRHLGLDRVALLYTTNSFQVCLIVLFLFEGRSVLNSS